LAASVHVAAPQIRPGVPTYMKRSDLKNTPELVGIVISGMPRLPQPSVFTAYVWGPAPAVAEDSETKKP
jgi:hypothetical protein